MSVDKPTAAAAAVDDKQFVALGCVINLYSIAAQLCDPTVTPGASRRSSIALSRSSAVGVDESTTAVAQNKTGGLYGTQEASGAALRIYHYCEVCSTDFSAVCDANRRAVCRD